MAREDFIPSADDDFVAWLGNFVGKLTNTYAATFGITPAQTASLALDYQNMRHLVVEYLPAIDAGKRNRVAYKDLIRRGKTAGGAPVPTTPQPIPSPTIATGTPPASPAVPNVEARIRVLVKQIKASAGYTNAIGVDLRIVAPTGTTDPADARPKVSAAAKPSGVVVLTWVKGKYDGVVIEAKRGAETQFGFLDRDFKSPYVDTRANLAIGVPELRTYRLRYETDGAAVGVFCDDVKVSTLV